MTDAEFTLNGILAGHIYQDGFNRFKYDITKLLFVQGANSPKLRVKKTSTNQYRK